MPDCLACKRHYDMGCPFYYWGKPKGKCEYFIDFTEGKK